MINKITRPDTGSLIALLWTVACIYFLDFILKNFGKEKEILTLVIGLIGGTITGTIMGFYFAGTSRPKDMPGKPGTTTATISAAVSTEPTTPTKDELEATVPK